MSVQAFPVLGQAAAAVEPADSPFDDPAFGQYYELPSIGALDDLDVDLPADEFQSPLKFRPLIAAVGVEFEQKRIGSEQRTHQQHAAIAVLHIGSMDNGLEQQSLGVYQDVAFLALDLLAGIKTMPVDRTPPFSALLTLWLSMMAAVGLLSRPANSRHSI